MAVCVAQPFVQCIYVVDLLLNFDVLLTVRSVYLS